MTTDTLELEPPATAIAVIETSVVEYSATAQGLAELQHRLKGIAYTGLATGAGMQEAIDDRRELIDLRVGLGKLCEKLNKDDRAATKLRCETRDTEAEKLVGIVKALEAPIDGQIKAEEARKEAIRLEKLAKEKARCDAHAAAITKIRGYVAAAQGLPSDRIAKGLAFVEAMQFDPAACEDFLAEYQAAQIDTTVALQALFTTTKAAEDAAAEQIRQREENARLAAQLAEQKAKLDAIEAEQKARSDALAAAEAKQAEDARRAEEAAKAAAVPPAAPIEQVEAFVPADPSAPASEPAEAQSPITMLDEPALTELELCRAALTEALEMLGEWVLLRAKGEARATGLKKIAQLRKLGGIA